MRSLRWRSRTALILPLVLLTLVVLEELAAYQLRQRVHDPHLRAAALLILFGVAFAVAVEWIAPALARFFTRVRQGSRREAGRIGLWLFYAAAYGALYWAFYVMETRGVAELLPAALR